ncbi:uncharacterized protein [Porites lutea]|uniref:uncharacterized protein isoform X1 n=1 Tax=Porites lutea TaxID=51062 RepID=UPI003CC66AFB
MGTDHDDVHLLLSQELKDIRSKIVEGKLVLFVGEQASILVTPDQLRPSLDDWWHLVNHSEQNGVKELLNAEEKYLENLQQAPSRIHNALRNVGNFPFIITTNMDELLERFLWKTGNGGEKIRLDQISCLAQSWPDLRRHLVVKCFGDGGFNVRILPNSKRYFEEFCGTLESPEVEFFRQVFNDRSVLFLGCDPNREEYKKIFQKFAVNAKMKHYKFETSGESDLEKDGNLLTLKANIQPWEFVQFLSTGTIQEDIQPGKVYERSYLRIQREEYLQQQLALEKMASEIVFHTISITNALSPDEFFEQVSRPTIQSIFKQDPFGVYSEEKVQRTMDAMKGRRDNLIQLIDGSREISITALFFYHGVKKEIELWKEAEKLPSSSEDQKKKLQKCRISISKYAKAILRCKSLLRSNSSLEIRIVGDQGAYNVQEVEKETFALIRLKGGQDEAVCYAETATSPDDRKFANHLININGDVVLNKRKVYERSRANAWNNEDSILKLATAIMKESSEMKKRFGIDAIDVDDLKALETLTRISQKVRSQLDPGYLEPLGEGSFGQVYRAKKNGRQVAVKILKEVDKDKVKYFEREVDTLREARHPKIVEVIECITIQNQLAIVMEFMAGGNLKVFLGKGKRGQGKEFTLRFIEDIGSAVEHLHSQGFTHRDIKPENIFLSEDHKLLKLGDFGLARATEGTRQTKTLIGSWRYMAPEVMIPGGHYSKKADVYSFGLCLIEVLSGKIVFADILEDKTVYDKKKAGENPVIPKINLEEFGEELAAKLRTIVEECLKPGSHRPEMKLVLSILRGEVTSNRNKVELYCVGTGTGTTAILHGKPSSSVIISQDGKPILMADVGAGVLNPCREKLVAAENKFPRNVFISHNHMDHSGELPMLFAVESKRRHAACEPRLKVLCGPEVEHKLKVHRLDEMLTMYRPEQVADWVVCKQDGDPTYLDEDRDFFITVYRTLHGEVCYGFLLYFKNKPILGYCVDSGFQEDVYKFFFQASTVVVDARKEGSQEHASFTEVAEYVKKEQFGNKSVYITGYGIDSEYPDEGVPGVQQLRADQYVTLWDEHTDGL